MTRAVPLNMDQIQNESRNAERTTSTMSASSSSIRMYIAEGLELPEDTFRMSLDNFSVIGENVTIADRDTSIDTLSSSKVHTPVLMISTPLTTPDTPTPIEKSLPITDTPIIIDEGTLAENVRKPRPTLIQLSLTKKSDDDIFAKPSPVSDLMSPAKMLQFEVNFSTSATPTMRRAPIDFAFFMTNKFDEYFKDILEGTDKPESKEIDGDIASDEALVIVKPDTVRHEIGYASKK